MNIDFGLASEIYGRTPWCVSASYVSILDAVLQSAKQGFSLAAGEGKNNTPLFAILDSATRKEVVTEMYDLDNDSMFDAVGVITIDGVITNKGGQSSRGMLELSSTMLRMNEDSRVKGFIIHSDSGGGSSMAVDVMTKAIDKVRSGGKPVIGVIRRGGMACSAMYMILASCDYIYAESEFSLIGSNGTMIQFDGVKANSEQDGTKRIRLYASKSINKNRDVEKALNDNDYEPIINELLDPLNDSAIEKVGKYRPQLIGTDYHTGVELFAKDGVGTYIDGFRTFESVAKEILGIAVDTPILEEEKENNNNSKTSSMTLQELQSHHPSVFSEAVEIGASAEKDRVGSWMAHFETDSVMVMDGINSGKQITASVREQLLVKAVRGANPVAALEKATSEIEVTQPESTTIVDAVAEKESKQQSAWNDAFKLK